MPTRRTLAPASVALTIRISSGELHCQLPCSFRHGELRAGRCAAKAPDHQVACGRYLSGGRHPSSRFTAFRSECPAWGGVRSTSALAEAPSSSARCLPRSVLLETRGVMGRDEHGRPRWNPRRTRPRTGSRPSGRKPSCRGRIGGAGAPGGGLRVRTPRPCSVRCRGIAVDNSDASDRVPPEGALRLDVGHRVSRPTS